MRKEIVVKVLMKPTREIVPISIFWSDGREYEIDKILDVRPTSSKSGGMGLRFEVRMRGKIRFLFLDEYVWFVDVE